MGGNEREPVASPASRLWSAVSSPRAALVVFVAFLVVSVPVAVHLGGFRWFFVDDWAFITARQIDSVDDVLGAYNDHWVSIPVVLYRLLYAVFGIRTYLPYQLVAIASHLAVVVLVRMVLRRNAVGPWLATGTASVLVLFGPGGDNIVLGFQVAFTGALALALAQLLLADHRDPDVRRDGLALLFGLFAIMTSGVAIPVVVATGVALLVRHGWRRAAIQTVPLGALYLLWLPFFPDPNTAEVAIPGVRTELRWVWNAATGTFIELGQHRAIAFAIVAILVIGMGVAIWAPTGGPGDVVAAEDPGNRSSWSRAGAWISRRIAPVAVPLALVAAALGFAALAAQGRWPLGADAARSSRYLYIYVALMLPAFGVAAQALVSRSRLMGPVVGVLLVGIIAMNLTTGSFADGGAGTDSFYRGLRDATTMAASMPEARQVPADVRPYPVFTGPVSPGAGFLVQALDDGKLDLSSQPISPDQEGELRVRLGLAQRDEDVPPEECTLPVVPTPTVYPVGTRFLATAPIQATLFDEAGKPASPPVSFVPSAGQTLTVELPDLPLGLAIAGDGRFRRCEDR